MKVLIIDQDKETVRQLENALAGHEVHVDRDSAEGLAHALDASWQRAPYDVVFCELVMPGLAGCDVALALRTHEDPPASVLLASPELLANARTCTGRVLAKPLVLADVRRIVEAIAEERARKPTTRLRRVQPGLA